MRQKSKDGNAKYFKNLRGLGVPPPMSKITKVFKTFPPEQQGDFLIVIEANQYNDVSMKFEAYECTMTDVYENGIIVIPFAYEKTGASCNLDVTGDYREADSFAEGYVNWEGCINLDFLQENYHFCDIDDTRKFNTLFEKLYKIAPQCIEKWDGD